MVSKLRAYFFRKDLENFKQSDVPEPSKRNSSLLFVLDATKTNIIEALDNINSQFKNVPFRIYYLVYDPSGKVENKSNIFTYTKKDLSWNKTLLKPQDMSLLKQAHHLVIFSQKKFKKDFEFIAKAVSANLNIGYQENADTYNLDLAIDQKEEDLPKFLEELKTLIPELLKRHSLKKTVKSQLDVSL